MRTKIIQSHHFCPQCPPKSNQSTLILSVTGFAHSVSKLSSVLFVAIYVHNIEPKYFNHWFSTLCCKYHACLYNPLCKLIKFFAGRMGGDGNYNSCDGYLNTLFMSTLVYSTIFWPHWLLTNIQGRGTFCPRAGCPSGGHFEGGDNLHYYTSTVMAVPVFEGEKMASLGF